MLLVQHPVGNCLGEPKLNITSPEALEVKVLDSLELSILQVALTFAKSVPDGYWIVNPIIKGLETIMSYEVIIFSCSNLLLPF